MELHFECQRCGACCSTWQGRIYLHPKDIPALSDELKLLPGQFLRDYTSRDLLGYRYLALKKNGFCIFYEDGKCIVNVVKPGSCRAWPFWRKVCTTRRGWESASRRCPGIGKGRAWSPDEIKARLELSP